jgi:integrase
MAEKIKLTKTTVEGLKLPTKGQVFFWDSELPGFAVKLTSTGRTYVAERRVDGKTRRVTIGKHTLITADQARKKALKALSEMNDGIDPNARKREQEALAVSLAAVVADYIADRGEKLRPATVNDFNKHLSGSFGDWQKKPIISITRDKVAARHKELSKKSQAQADLAFRYLKAWWNYARGAYQPDDVPILPENPVAVLGKQGRDLWHKIQPRENRIPDNKIGESWNTLQEMRYARINETAVDITCFLLLTGCRWREAAELTWDRVNLDEQWFYLPDPKNRRAVKLPLSDTLKNIIEDRKQEKGFVFPANTKSGHIYEARSALKKISALSGIPICHHDLRRTYTNIAWKKCKIDLSLVRLLTNHKMSGDVTVDVYGDAGDLQFLLPETNKISDWIIEQGEIAKRGNVIPFESRRKIAGGANQ